MLFEMTWEGIWEGIGSANLKKGGEPYIWQFYDKLLPGYSFKGKKVLEFGCGTGINSVIMAMRGASLTLVDSSQKALDIVRQNLDCLGLDAELLKMDVFDFREKNKYDLAHSEGLVEHFLPPKRQEIVDMHARAVKKGGRVLIIVPHAKNPPYRLGKRLAQTLGCWVYGNEYPYTRSELAERMRRAGVEPGKVLGGELLFSLFWLFTPITLNSSRLMRKGIVNPARPKWTRMNYANPLANRWGRVIGCVGMKV
jgi:2-polyprenyl-3-methyl-5-hydroxy-6-metoxy-1,4-benzoquinol methylase